VPREPWLFGNKYHMIACEISGVLFASEIVEGIDEPKEAPKKEHYEKVY